MYSIAKAGLAALTRSLALELAPRGARERRRAGRDRLAGGRPVRPGRAQRIVATTPLARIGSPEDIAQAVHFLACAPYVTGQIIAVDGGRSIFIYDRLPFSATIARPSTRRTSSPSACAARSARRSPTSA